jgi:putative ABC transport system ATP-binding protein
MQKPLYPIEKVYAMAELLGIVHILKQPARICSYGEQQRIAIIRALMQPFDLLLMDEPFSHLDLVNSKKAADLIAAECRFRNAGFVLTDLDEDDLFPYTRFLNL